VASSWRGRRVIGSDSCVSAILYAKYINAG
jgi:hypothetical protein